MGPERWSDAVEPMEIDAIMRTIGRFAEKRAWLKVGLFCRSLKRDSMHNRTQPAADESNRRGLGFQAGLVSFVALVLPVSTLIHTWRSSRLERWPVTVSSERSEADAIRRLGGWYSVDRERHIVEVNMVYHESRDTFQLWSERPVRYDNNQSGTDEVLQVVASLPNLRRLLLKDGQATDQGMQHVAKIRQLEELIVWDACQLTDHGVVHLENLKNLRTVHIEGVPNHGRSYASVRDPAEARGSIVAG